MKAWTQNFIANQKAILSSTKLLDGKIGFLVLVVCCITGIPIGCAAAVTLSICESYSSTIPHLKDELKRSQIIHYYISGYVLFLFCLLGLWCMFLMIGLPVYYLMEGSFHGVFDGAFVVTLQHRVEMMFCVCLFQYSMFYAIQRKQTISILKNKLFLFVFFMIAVLFYFARTYILEYQFLQNMMFTLFMIGLFVLPLVSVKKAI